VSFTHRSAGQGLNCRPTIRAPSIMTKTRFAFAALLTCCLAMADIRDASAMPSPIEIEPAGLVMDAASAPTRLAQTQPAPAPAPSPAPAATPAATASPAAADEPIGNVATLTGIATVIRNKDSIALKLQDDIYLNDVLLTSANSTLGVTFNDATTFNLTANARIVVDNFVYEEGGQQNGALFDIVKGTVAFAAAAVAKTGDMRISTPTATLGIRGTTGLVEVPEGASAASANHVAIKLYPDADGKVGRIEVNDHSGARLGFLTQGASGFTIRPGAGGRFAAQPLAISPQQAQRDQGIVRQVHAAQTVGRQIVTQRQIQRQQNPARNNPARTNPSNGNPPRNNPAANPPRQPGLPKQNGTPQRPGSPQQPAQPNRAGQPSQPAQPNRSEKPGSPQQPAAQPPGVQRPALQNRPAAQPPRRPAPPKAKPAPKPKKR
jgi:hypothetical protein